MHTIGQRSGFKIQGHWLQLYGLCAACQKPQIENN
jgi:Fe2+ or Zn2+ uptake regulation protein